MLKSENITIVLTSYNYASVIKRALYAIKKQTMQPYQCLIGEDCSTDDSQKIIQKFIRDIPWMQLIVNPNNLGNTGNVNSLISKVKSKYLILVSADDFLLPDYIERAENYITSFKEPGIVSATCLDNRSKVKNTRFYSSNFISTKPIYKNKSEFIKTYNFYGGFFKGATAIYKLELLKKHGIELGCFTDNFLSYQLAAHSGIVFDPMPGAVCDRNNDCYSLKELNSPKQTKKILDQLLNKGKNMNSKSLWVMALPIISWHLSNYFLEIIKRFNPNKDNFLSNKLFRKFIIYYFYSINFCLHERLFSSILLNIKYFFFINKNKKYLDEYNRFIEEVHFFNKK